MLLVLDQSYTIYSNDQHYWSQVAAWEQALQNGAAKLVAPEFLASYTYNHSILWLLGHHLIYNESLTNMSLGSHKSRDDVKCEWILSYKKWNPNLAFAKSDPKNGHFSLLWQCAWQEKCIFASFFLISLPRVFVHGNHFSHHFSSPF